jgi:hypothetical protein
VHCSPRVRQVAPVPPLGTASQVPDWESPQLPVPEQQSVGLAHASPIGLQGSARQIPLTQLSEQQSLAFPQASPGAAQNSLVVHFPPAPQVPEQHGAPPAVQARPSSTQAVDPLVQTPPSHRPAQHGSPPAVQAWLSATHALWTTQVFAKQVSPVQQPSGAESQGVLNAAQVGGGGGGGDAPSLLFEQESAKSASVSASGIRRRAGGVIGAPSLPDERPELTLRFPPRSQQVRCRSDCPHIRLHAPSPWDPDP